MKRSFSKVLGMVSAAVLVSATIMQVGATPLTPFPANGLRSTQANATMFPTSYGPYNARSAICDLDSAICDTFLSNFRPNFWIMFPQVDFGTTGLKLRDTIYTWYGVPWNDAGRRLRIVLDTVGDFSTGDTMAASRNTLGQVITNWTNGGWDGVDVKTGLVSVKTPVTGVHDVYVVAFDPANTNSGGVCNFYGLAFGPTLPNNEAGIRGASVHSLRNAALGFSVKNTASNLLVSLPSQNNWDVSVVSATGAVRSSVSVHGASSAVLGLKTLVAGSYIVRAQSSAGTFSQSVVISR